MSEEKSGGCEECRRGVYSARWPPPARVAAHASGWSFLHRCEACGAYWEFNVREAHVISEAEARQNYPEVWAGG